MPFSSILGQQKAIASLKAAIESGHVHHAYLFGGPEGVGKEMAAVALAQAMNCESPDGEDGCGRCGTCRRIATLNHPDMVWVMPEVEMIARKLAGNADFSSTPSKDIRISQVRSIQERLSFKPMEAKKRFVFICQAEAMNPQAQNALLKTLEEPPPDTVMVLVSSAPGQLLPTIRSRCLKLNFGPLPASVIEERLRQDKGLSAPVARKCAALSFGSMRTALSLDVEALSDLDDRLERLAGLDSGDALDALSFAGALAAEAKERKGQLETVLQLFEAWYRDVALLASTMETAEGGGVRFDQLPAAGAGLPPRPATQAAVFGDRLDLLAGSAERLGPVEPLRRIGLIHGVQARLRFNASPLLQLEQLFLRFNRSDA